ncbi:GntR family transcriptional regulator [Paracoccus pacificus]|uniref:GntR family transcriptional regulator n=1 Tax=Paracoccus pacificus TaxID=1463598 RepID=A0ABW4RAE4_9RHOB
MNTIDRTSSIPYYLQLARMFEARIGSGALGPGDQLPGESELCRQFGLSRSTVRETLRALESQNLIRIVPRRGAFVAAPGADRWMLQVAEGFLETHAAVPGRSVQTRVLSWGARPLPAKAAELTGVADSAGWVALERLRQVDGAPVMHSINWLPPEVAAKLEGSTVLQGQGSLNRALRAAGYPFFAARRAVAAVLVPPDLTRLLEVHAGTPVLRIDSVSRDAAGQVFDFYISHVRSDMVTIEVEAQAAIRD